MLKWRFEVSLSNSSENHRILPKNMKNITLQDNKQIFEKSFKPPGLRFLVKTNVLELLRNLRAKFWHLGTRNP